MYLFYYNPLQEYSNYVISIYCRTHTLLLLEHLINGRP